ncbi:MAG: hypothetical protein DRP45_10565 [Candidatus Zixiibacteriota bacterium]|nr:MAG: hypothetical protein DRP45_10565 [candidate division Zixibacteria bacterium]
MRSTLNHILTFTTLLLLVVATADGKEFRYDYQKIIETGPQAELQLTCFGGSMEIVSSTDDRIIIDAVKKVKAVSMIEAEEVADHIEIKVKQSGSKVEVETIYHQIRDRSSSFWKKIFGVGGNDSFGDVDWSIQVPQGCKVNITNTSGKILVSHTAGDVDIRSSTAEIELVGIEGEISVENSAGSIFGELLFGSVTVRQAQGQVGLRFVDGDIRVKTTTADIFILQESGSVDLVSTTGHITVQTNLDSTRDYFVETESGDITMSIPETSSGNLRIRSRTGEMKIEVPVSISSMSQREVQGAFGYGGAKIDLTSVSGDVKLAEF